MNSTGLQLIVGLAGNAERHGRGAIRRVGTDGHENGIFPNCDDRFEETSPTELVTRRTVAEAPPTDAEEASDVYSGLAEPPLLRREIKIMTTKSGIPVYFSMDSGNTNDNTTHRTDKLY